MATILDTRDLHDRLAELEERARAATIAANPDEYDEDERAYAADLDPLDGAERTELEELQTMRDEISDWEWGETLIPEEDFVAYAEELAEELDAIPRDAPWPLRHIDWRAAAEELRQDYTEYTYLGTTYLARA